MEIAIVKNNMIYKEARECADRICANMNNVRHLVLELYEREGWTALGYESWRECVVAEFKQGENYLYKQLAAAQAEKNICTIVQKDPIPESQLRPLTRLEPDQQREAWQRAVETAPESGITAAHVKKIVDEMLQENEPEQEQITSEVQPYVDTDSRNLHDIKISWSVCKNADRLRFLKWAKERDPKYFKGGKLK
jgi:hypothetical protein